MDYVEAALQGFGVDKFDGGQFVQAELAAHRKLREKRQSEAALHHTLGGFDGVNLERDVRHQASPAKKAMSEGPVAGAVVIKNQWPGCDLFQSRARCMSGPAA